MLLFAPIALVLLYAEAQLLGLSWTLIGVLFAVKSLFLPLALFSLLFARNFREE
ncbi:hypothetical protein ACX9MO_03745 [Pseudooceanicola sp. 502str34]|uniref:hypothetical protein n=1 Tax=Maritimibacter alkaliphilus TaxID=404236 RepID=UPI001C9892DC|nr:hypothetical protein [Maritimibacter alkaliphilus]MBY6091393.1 hypothetical protein [Maritimibacter alkaliphilus]